ncbi:MAG: hypothetical protein E2O77_11770 [Caldithrix sp.]|nr:MAG: hypothetical protein E2O77_11770 [Caldithrix sp.]
MTKMTRLLPALFLITIACGSNNTLQHTGRGFLETGDYDLAIIQLRAEERMNPADVRIKRDLGIAYFRTKQYEKAVSKLSQAAKLNSRDQVSLFYLGVNYEFLQQLDKAAIVYRACSSLDIKDELKNELLARSQEIELKYSKKQIRDNLSELKNSNSHVTEPNSVAVLYFRNISEWRELTPLLKGLAEVLITDLGKVQRLKIVKRKKVQLLLDELHLTPCGLLDQLKMRDTGRMLGAAKLITGGIERVDNTRIRLTAGVVDTKSGQLQGESVQAAGRLSEIPELEKILLVGLLKSLGVRLNSDEAKALQQFPTKNNLAFIAFSKGLDFEDRNIIRQAKYQYEKAINLDAEFKLAKQRLAQLSQKRLTIAEMEKLLPQSYKNP